MNQSSKARRPNAPAKAAQSRLGPASLKTEIVLLAVTGMAPAILTETVWALAQETPPVIPGRLVVVTTSTGRGQIERDLFEPHANFNGLCCWDSLRAALAERGLSLEKKLRFGTTGDDLRVFAKSNPKTGRTSELSDIRTREENEAAADFLLRQVREIVETPDTQLIASIAGGRKTMGALLYACMSLLGRETDRLTHVLVDEPFENARLEPRFYFPAQSAASLVLPDGAKFESATAHIQLADIPFVPLRNLFARELVKKPSTFTALVARCKEQVEGYAQRELRLVVRRAQPEIIVNGLTPVRLSLPEYAIILYLADAARKGMAEIASYKDAGDVVRAMAEQLYSKQDATDFGDWRAKAKPEGGFAEIDDRWVTKNLSSLRAKLRDAGSDGALLAKLLPVKERFSLNLPKGSIELRD